MGPVSTTTRIEVRNGSLKVDLGRNKPLPNLCSQRSPLYDKFVNTPVEELSPELLLKEVGLSHESRKGEDPEEGERDRGSGILPSSGNKSPGNR